MNNEVAIVILNRANAVITNSHVVYTSWKHGSVYVNKDAIYPYVVETARICGLIAQKFEICDVHVVIAPAVGGIKLSDRVAQYLAGSMGRSVLSVYAEKETIPVQDPEGKGRNCFAETGEFVIKRGYDKLVTGKNVLVVEDVLTTGTTARKVVEATRRAGGHVVGLGAICNRGGVTNHDVGDVPRLEALANITLEAWNEGECPLCKQKIPINTDVGKGKEFLARKRG